MPILCPTTLAGICTLLLLTATTALYSKPACVRGRQIRTDCGRRTSRLCPYESRRKGLGRSVRGAQCQGGAASGGRSVRGTQRQGNAGQAKCSREGRFTWPTSLLL